MIPDKLISIISITNYPIQKYSDLGSTIAKLCKTRNYSHGSTRGTAIYASGVYISRCIYERYILIGGINRSWTGCSDEDEEEAEEDAIGQGPAGVHVAKTNRSSGSRIACLFALGRIGLLKINDSRADVNMIGCVS